MISCKDCYLPMVGVMSFSKDKHGGFRHEKFCQCSKCRGKTKPVPIMDSELMFKESLYNAMKK